MPPVVKRGEFYNFKRPERAQDGKDIYDREHVNPFDYTKGDKQSNGSFKFYLIYKDSFI